MDSSIKTAVAMLYSRPKTPEWYAEQQRLFVDAIAPITRMKMHLYSIYMPTVILDEKGALVSVAYPEEMQEQIKKLDALIQQMADQWKA